MRYKRGFVSPPARGAMVDASAAVALFLAGDVARLLWAGDAELRASGEERGCKPGDTLTPPSRLSSGAAASVRTQITGRIARAVAAGTLTLEAQQEVLAILGRLDAISRSVRKAFLAVDAKATELARVGVRASCVDHDQYFEQLSRLRDAERKYVATYNELTAYPGLNITPIKVSVMTARAPVPLRTASA